MLSQGQKAQATGTPIAHAAQQQVEHMRKNARTNDNASGGTRQPHRQALHCRKKSTSPKGNPPKKETKFPALEWDVQTWTYCALRSGQRIRKKLVTWRSASFSTANLR